VTRHWKERRARGEENLFKFLLAYSKPSRAQRKQYEALTGRKAPKPLTEKEREAWAQKAFAQIKGRGLGEMEMITICDLLEEWWAKEKKKRAKKNWKKALEAIGQNENAALEAKIASYQEKCRKDKALLGF